MPYCCGWLPQEVSRCLYLHARCCVTAVSLGLWRSLLPHVYHCHAAFVLFALLRLHYWWRAFRSGARCGLLAGLRCHTFVNTHFTRLTYLYTLPLPRFSPPLATLVTRGNPTYVTMPRIPWLPACQRVSCMLPGGRTCLVAPYLPNMTCHARCGSSSLPPPPAVPLPHPCWPPPPYALITARSPLPRVSRHYRCGSFTHYRYAVRTAMDWLRGLQLFERPKGFTGTPLLAFYSRRFSPGQFATLLI